MSSHLDAYVSRLRKELSARWLDQDRLIAEAREHLVDRIEDGRRRGLSPEEAEQQAFDGFGSPETIAACAAAERNHMWDRKWWVLIPTITLAVVASAVSYYVLPVRYQSEARLQLIPVSNEHVPDGVASRLKDMSDQLSSARLEQVIEDLNLYENERRTTSLGSVVRQMRRDINVTVAEEDGSRLQAVAVRFFASDPRLAQRGTARLASLFIDEHMRQAPGVDPLATGVQLKIVEPPGLSAQPVGPSPAKSGAIGAGGGLLLGLTFVAVSTRRRRENEE